MVYGIWSCLPVEKRLGIVNAYNYASFKNFVVAQKLWILQHLKKILLHDHKTGDVAKHLHNFHSKGLLYISRFCLSVCEVTFPVQ